MLRTTLSLVLSVSVVFAAPLQLMADSRPSDAVVAQANKDVEKQALRLLVFSSLLAKDLAKIEKVPEAVKERYNSLTNTYLLSIPAPISGGGAAWLTVTGSKKIEFLWQPLTAVFRFIGQNLKASSESTENVIEAVYRIPSIKFVADQVGQFLENSIELAAKSVKSFVFKGSEQISGALVLGGGLSASIYLGTTSTEEILDYKAARALLNYDEELTAQVNAVVEDAAGIFELSPDQVNRFRDALSEEIIKQSIANKFSSDQSLYNVDVLTVLFNNNLIDESQLVFVRSMADIYNKLSESGALANRSVIESLGKNIEQVALLTAVLEDLSNSGVIKEAAQKAEVDRILGSVTAKMKLAMSQLGLY